MKNFSVGKIHELNHRYVVFQRPNYPLIVWFVGALAARLIGHGFIHAALAVISLAALIIWALLEIFQGASYFRRGLGLVVLGFTLYARFAR